MSEDTSAKKRVLKKRESVRERAEKATLVGKKQRRLHKTANVVAKPFKTARRIGKKEYYLPMPDNRVGQFMNKRRRVTPVFFRDAFRELRQVTWPSRRETWKLTMAVFVFATTFGLIIAVTDYGLDKLFRKLILK